jgi:hypothetical protein
MSKLGFDTDLELEHAEDKSAKRQEQMYNAAREAVRKANKVNTLCYQWMRDNKPELFEQFRQQVGYKQPYHPRPDLRGKRVIRNVVK